MNKGFQRATFSESTAAQHLVVAAPQDQIPPLPLGSRIRIRGGFLTAAAAQDAEIQSASTKLDTVRFGANFSLILPPLEGGVGEAYLECAVDEPLNITLGQGVQTDGVIFYDVVTP